MFLPQEIIRKKRDNTSLSKEEIYSFIKNVTNGSITDAQISAFAMTVLFNKLSKEELVNLTLAMRDSGEVLNWDNINGPVVDKHSTGGVGDLTSLMLAPMVAACGAYVPMIAGRGLGHTGGTLDKLEAIPNYNIIPDTKIFKDVVSKIGCAIVGQSSNLAPADKRIYAVRDTTATTESLELITSSILSKKLASGLQSLVMDIKTGNGAFLTTLEESKRLAQNIVNIGNSAGSATTAVITDMNQPLANTAGNALEIIDAIKYLKGDFSNTRLHKVILALGSSMLKAAKLVKNIEEAHNKLMKSLSSGKALEIFAKMLHALGGPADFIEDYKNYLPKANIVKPVYSNVEGVVTEVDTKKMGLIVVSLGGGRLKVSDKIDYSVGLSDIVSIGDKVTSDTPLAFIHAQNEDSYNRASKILKDVITVLPIEKSQISIPEVIYEYIY
ncbi:UNVERIFIED_CONTAM: hypothetical protein PYX00_010922 [Menopon gallinae]|uniref:Thymidine phosphorylase n=1 Tax=Menopon gallinae TaxID=328185 RepID=A0AAW2H6W2_9NEOP